MSSYRYLELIKKSTENELKRYIRIIESESGYSYVITNFNNHNKANLELTLKELISKKLKIARESLDNGNLTEIEEYELGDCIDDLFDQSRGIQYEFSNHIGWLNNEPRALYFFVVIVQAIVNTGNIELSYPATTFSFEAKSKSLSGEKYLPRYTDYLKPLADFCPNKTGSTYDNLVSALEVIITSSLPKEQRSTYRLLKKVESLYTTVFIKRNADRKAFKTDDAKLISRYYRYLTKKYPSIGLSITEDVDKQKQTIMCIFDVLCATKDPDTFKQLENKLVEKFNRSKRDKADGKVPKTTKEEKTLTFSESDWAKLIEIAGDSAKNGIKAKLKELIDKELANQKDAKEGNVGQDSNGNLQATQTHQEQQDDRSSRFLPKESKYVHLL
ncbi:MULTISPECIES: hypothetical protein [Vibrio]|uniref:hypothetical protein n=1 Tax=Vibrio TaxID=662 RepID=UPI00084B5DD3|nr:MULTISPECIES: hypothetical protein [Vibrio]NOF04704.1 hypothetical protein [Vibrio cholerae]ODY10465.1 hypothetical protein BBM17_20300 [Vibrio parahaemolyticus]